MLIESANIHWTNHRTCAVGAFVAGFSVGEGGHGLRGRGAATAAVEEGKDVGQVVELGAAAGDAVAHSVVQKAAVGPGADHQLAACSHIKTPLRAMNYQTLVPPPERKNTATLQSSSAPRLWLMYVQALHATCHGPMHETMLNAVITDETGNLPEDIAMAILRWPIVL